MAEHREQPPTSMARADDSWEHVAEEEVAKKLSSMQIHVPKNDPPSNDGATTATLSSPVSRGGAAAVSAASSSGPLDPVLVGALENPRERLTLLKFEDQIVSFIRAGREMQLVFPPLSSYHRLIVHRLADRCFLEHETGDYNPYAGGFDAGSAARVVTLFRTPRCAVPPVLFIDLSAEQNQPQPPHHHTIAPKIMTRKTNNDKQKKHAKTPGADARSRNLEDREKAYAEARARIFGETADAPAKAAPTKAAKQPEKPRPQNWKESKVTWRNREQELNDPDFTRHRTPYRAPPTYHQHQPSPVGYYAPRPVLDPTNEYSRGDASAYRPPPPPNSYYQQPPPRSYSGFAPRPMQRTLEKPNLTCTDDFPPLGQ
ncbi:hypothetical protein SDRG_01232 [Saprolegnia diclina VS20]|uniref:SUZ domain-containing protein n=1 Tax=Saprolegnia diclina (strain VS20) TaxID=1156394 RepID=T0SEC3_SAPDV|nr:hypothetical protein SDRG_01232 [Saprolegnia diclina VS20]EQC41257.1 hypothetical protein SDRG_01232 [Saprolegnia diclina VS20]|eukprot:XP_008604971.1 hypothetical protein SDRG_01232 [Saprolegnia diclina VS20]